MDPDPSQNLTIQILFILFLTLINAFFASAEMAIVSLNKNKIRRLADEGNKKALMLEKLFEEPTNFLSTIQVGITLAGFFASAFASTGMSDDLANVLRNMGIPYSSQIALVTITIALSYLTLVFGELFPKRIALQMSETIAMFSIKPIVVISKIARPFVKLLSGSTNLLVRIAGLDSEGLDEKVSREELKTMIEVGQENGIINETEKEMLESIFDFDDKVAKEVMTPRQEVFSVEINDHIDKCIEGFLEEKFTRIPVYEDNIDNIIGVLHIKDFFLEAHKHGFENIDINSILREPYFVPETKSIDVLFKDLQGSKNHMAILIDEYGGFSGIVTIEDLIEEVMGNIFDEHDENEPDIKKIDNDTYIVDGLLSIEDVNDQLDLDLKSEHSDTIGGFVVDLIGSIPTNEECKIIEYENLVFEIEEVREKRIGKVRMHLQREV